MKVVSFLRAGLAACLLALLLTPAADARSVAAKKGHAKRRAGKSHVAAVRSAARPAESPPVYGPFLPLEPFLYPQPPCFQSDVVREARVHEEGPASSEGQVEPETALQAPPAAAGTGEPAKQAALASVARRLSSFFRPRTSSAKIRPEDVDLADLLSARLLIPVAGVDVQKLRDSFLATRGRHGKHMAIDIGAPRGTPVLATADGEIVKTPREKRGGRTIYMKDTSGQYLFYYAHLKKVAPGIAAGRPVKKGDVIGYVGATGHVVGGPHLHFSIARVPGEEDTQREGLAINPYLLFLAAAP